MTNLLPPSRDCRESIAPHDVLNRKTSGLKRLPRRTPGNFEDSIHCQNLDQQIGQSNSFEKNLPVFPVSW